jgi:DNA primase
MAEINLSDGRVVEVHGAKGSGVAICPFHDEKTPSMLVETGADFTRYHCLSCGEKGAVRTVK